ncbi:PIG-L deacetylase family protein [Actinomycetospora atypica]|uniref:PIG-L deacetylase family protein n=1 Tax=Actinomycetospora atypica TaxID=1290095 RepID=A0ABV9YK05_9PSEU
MTLPNPRRSARPGRDLTGTGTDEARWRSSDLLPGLPRVGPDACRPPGRVVVLAPHPDDEVLGAGATLAAWAAAGTEVVVVAVTDGEGSHPGSPTLVPADLVRLRDAERRRALERLGLGGSRLVRAGLPDGHVAAHRDELADLLHGELLPGDTVLAPLSGDGHPDHDAVADVAGATTLPVWRYAVWLWHWADPDGPDVPRDGAVAVTVDAAALAAKRAAVDEFTTQVRPLSDDPRDGVILPPGVLARLLREIEVLWTT